MMMTDKKSVAILFCALLLVTFPLIPAVSAQQTTGVTNNSTGTSRQPVDDGSHWIGPATDRNPQETPNNPTNESGGNGTGSSEIGAGSGGHGDGNGGDDGGGGGWFSGGVGLNLPSTEDMTKAALDFFFKNWLSDKLTAMFIELVGVFNNFIAGSPYPHNQGYLGIFGFPEHGTTWGEWFYGIYVPIVMPLSLFILIFSYMIRMTQGMFHGFIPAWPSPGEVLWKTLGVAGIVLTWWQLGTALMRINHELAMFIAPSGTDFVHNMNGVVKASSGMILTTILTKGLAASQLVGLVMVYAVRHGILVLYMLVMPLLLVSAFLIPVQRARSFFGKMSWHFGTALLTVYPTVFLLKIGFESDVDFGFGPIGDALVGVGFLFAAIVAILFMGWTSVAAHRMTKGAAKNLAPSPMQDEAEDDSRIKSELKDRFNQGRVKLRTLRNKYPRPTPLGSTRGSTDRETSNPTKRPLNAMRDPQPNKSTSKSTSKGQKAPLSSTPTSTRTKPKSTETTNSRTPVSTRAVRADGGRSRNTKRDWSYSAPMNRSNSKE